MPLLLLTHSFSARTKQNRYRIGLKTALLKNQIAIKTHLKIYQEHISPAAAAHIPNDPAGSLRKNYFINDSAPRPLVTILPHPQKGAKDTCVHPISS